MIGNNNKDLSLNTILLWDRMVSLLCHHDTMSNRQNEEIETK